MDERLKVLLVNTLDREGGAEQVAWSLLERYRARGHQAWLAVGVKRSDDDDVFRIANERTPGWWSRTWWRIQAVVARLDAAYHPMGEKLRRIFGFVAEPQAIVDTLRGYEHSYYPGTYHLPDLPPERPDILHLHSLQRGYFELEALPTLSRAIPTVLTLHDAWLLSGHCTHPFGCERWLTGCGSCPDLTIPPRLLRDETARNWRRKRDIFAESRIWLAVNSNWLLQKVKASMLSYVDARVISPGIDLNCFQPGNQAEARRKVGLPSEPFILLFVATKAQTNPWKDFRLLEKMVRLVQGEMPEKEVILLVVGDPQGKRLVKRGPVWFAPLTTKRDRLKDYYQAADLYTHATHVETFGLTVIEALAVGIPAIVTDVAALPEVVEHGVTGFLTPPGDAEAMARYVVQLLRDDQQRAAMSVEAVRFAQQFDADQTADQYLSWYREILEAEASCSSKHGHGEGQI